jgi:uncharacterized membrane protein YedE/YeeE
MSADRPASIGFRADYAAALVEPWSPYVGAILLLLAVFALMVSGQFWGVFGGIKLWGDWFNHLIGLGGPLGIHEPDSPLMQRLSLMNICLVLGAFCAALLSRQFRVRRPPALELVWGALGGSLMGLGAVLAGGCTVGAFLVPALHASPSGFVMLAGLMLGAVIGLKALMWSLERVSWGTRAPAPKPPSARALALYPWLGVVVMIAMLMWAASWYSAQDSRLTARGIIILAGFAIGFIMHRSRFCVARAVREPFMTGEGDMTKAVILMLAAGIPFASLIFQAGLLDPYLAIPPRFWLGSLTGGVVFGAGMVFAGGCGTGSLWRVGEGHIKLWVAVFFFAWVGSTAGALLHRAGLTAAEMNLDLLEESPLGIQMYFPVLLDGWGWTYLAAGALLLLWYLLVRYNESSGRFTVV